MEDESDLAVLDFEDFNCMDEVFDYMVDLYSENVEIEDHYNHVDQNDYEVSLKRSAGVVNDLVVVKIDKEDYILDLFETEALNNQKEDSFSVADQNFTKHY